MNKLFIFLITVLLTSNVFAQSPEKMSYQAVIRDGSNNLVTSTAVGMRIQILQGSEFGAAVYVETQTPTSNANGLVSLEIGAGTVVSGTFATIDWANGPFFIKTETDPTGGTNYTITGTSQLLSVPYALHAKTAETVTGTINETDPVYGASVASGITGTNITNWNNKQDQLTTGTGINITGTTISNTAPDQTINLTPGGATTISGTYPNFTISSTDNNTTYTTGTGINITGTTITNTAPDQTVNLTPGGATTISGTYPNFTISSTDNNTTYTSGTGIILTGNVIRVDSTKVWNTTGNAGTNPTTDYIGTADNVPFNIKVNNTLAGHIGIATDNSVFLGLNAGLNDDATNNNNTFIGTDAGKSNTSGNWNTATGRNALLSNTTGVANTATSVNALTDNTTGSHNTATGTTALSNNSTGSFNVAVGNNALLANTTASNNTAVGFEALKSNTTGDRNVAMGNWSLYSTTTGIQNTAIGYYAGNSGNYNNRIAIGYNVQNTASNQVRIGNSSVTSIGGFAGWTNVSDSRFKTGIKENVVGLDFIMNLRPVTYHLDMDAIANFLKTPEEQRLKEAEQTKSTELQTGFIAQEVEEAAKKSGIVFSGVDAPKNENDYYGLRYAEFVVPLVKAVQEQQQMIKNQQQMIESQQQEIHELKELVHKFLK